MFDGGEEGDKKIGACYTFSASQFDAENERECDDDLYIMTT